MGLNLLIGPPGSGKTTRLLGRAREALAAGQRVWWVGLPAQRSYVYRRATEQGALLGLEFLSAQQVYYRLLARALALRPLIKQTGRIALVGEALVTLRRELPTPGEARLFSYAIAEAKRYGVAPGKLQATDAESLRFREVFAHYEAIKGDQWDYDDFRSAALQLAERGAAEPEAELLIVDGFRELGPLEWRLYRALARRVPVWLSLPEAPPGATPTERLPPRAVRALQVYRAANPVAEARWVLRALKGDLAAGSDPLTLAVVLPDHQRKAFASLADEYGVPLMDEAPRALADSLAGRLLLDLLELPDYPTAARLLAIPELAPVAKAVLAQRVVGMEAVTALADRLGLGAVWRKWLALLASPRPNEDEVAWAKALVETGLPELNGDLVDDLGWQLFKDYAAERAQEASRVGKGVHFRKWWAALLQETTLPARPQGGVALLNATLVSGRRFAKCYVLHATEGAYTVGEGEDYFIPEEARRPLEAVFRNGGLPRRFLGRDRLLFAELRSRADEVIVTYPEADQDGPLVPEPALVGDAKPPRLPTLPAASRLELPAAGGYRAELQPLPLGTVTVQALKRYDDCAFRYWADMRLKLEDEAERPWWLKLVEDLRAHRRLNPARLEVLKETYREAAGWLADYAGKLTRLTYDVRLPEQAGGVQARLDAAWRSGNQVTLYRFVAPDRIRTQAEAADYIDDRWNELWAAGYLLSTYAGRIARVDVVVWPILGAPIDAYEGGITYLWRRIAHRHERVKAAYRRYARGEVTPKPGYRCRSCPVFDVCREGKR